MATAVAQNRVRVVGAGFTLFTFGGQVVTFCQEVQTNTPRLVAPPSYIQPLDEPYPVEIIVPPAATAGSIVLNLIELFGSGGHVSKVWDRLGANITNNSGLPFGAYSASSFGVNNTSAFINLTNNTPGVGPFGGAVDIVDIAIRQAQLDPSQMAITKIVRPLSAGDQAPAYTEDYVGCVITDVTDGENVQVGSKEVFKQITVAYRYLTRNGVPSQAFAQRDGQIANITPSQGAASPQGTLP